jgi:predicted O-methyltransferase YrrM
VRASRRAVAEEVLAQSREHDATQSDRLDRFRNLEPETAELLALLVRATSARKILELGTSNGYSTIWLADAAEGTGARFTSVEIDAERTAMAAAVLERVGLAVQLMSADAREVLAGSPDGAWDLIFLDAERDAYADYWPELLRVLRADGGLLAVDNVLSHPQELVEFTALVDAEPTVSSSVVSCGAGLRLIVRGADA